MLYASRFIALTRPRAAIPVIQYGSLEWQPAGDKLTASVDPAIGLFAAGKC